MVGSPPTPGTARPRDPREDAIPFRQLFQSLKTGELKQLEIPDPEPGRGRVLIRSEASLVSAGTERMLLEFGQSGLLGKVRKQPEKVKQVLDKIRTDGLVTTLEAVQRKLDQPIPLGYCNAGVVEAVGPGVRDLAVGDRVISNGPHAERVVVPQNLVAPIPGDVPAEQAAFTVLAAIALQGVRLLEPTLGERFVVSGLGLIGLIAVQVLRANGCRVLGLDFHPDRLALAAGFGAETFRLGEGADVGAAVAEFTAGMGADGVVIAASTKSSDPVSQAANACRKRGRIVLVGVTGLELNRAEFYEKELTFQVSCSYGPGRYDPVYEERGVDYPAGFVRWTERRNFEAVLDLIAAGSLRVEPLITDRFEFAAATDAYGRLGAGDALGIVLRYPAPPAGEAPPPRRPVVTTAPAAAAGPGAVAVGIVGAGNFSVNGLLPVLAAQPGVRLRSIASRGGVSGTLAADRYSIERSYTDVGELLADPELDAVFVLTRHDSHATLAADALDAGRHVFVEKPLALTEAGADAVASALARAAERGEPRQLAVGFNRRFAPQVSQMAELLARAPGPKAVNILVNAGGIPADHWVHDPGAGGGRWVGEGCHFVDLARFLVAAPICGAETVVMTEPGADQLGDKLAVSLRFEDGSLAAIQYLANGDKSFPKERVEVFAGGRVLQLDNFRQLTGYGFQGFNKTSLWRQDKGHRACVEAFLAAVRSGGAGPIPVDELFEVTRWTIRSAPGAPASG